MHGGLSGARQDACVLLGWSSNCLFGAVHSETARDLSAKLIKSEIEITRSPHGPQPRPRKAGWRRTEKVAGVAGACVGARAHDPGPRTNPVLRGQHAGPAPRRGPQSPGHGQHALPEYDSGRSTTAVSG